MKPAQLESLLDNIEQLQQIMKEIAVGESDLEDEEDNYAQLYKNIELQLDLLREQGVSVSNPNSFRTLRDWRKHSWSLGRPADRIVDVYNQYHNTLTVVERFLAHQYVSSGDLPDALTNGLHPQSLRNLLTSIQEIQGIMKQVARGTNIEDKEETYSQKYRELALQIAIFQELGLAIPNPNCFRSLWQFYSFWDSELESGYAAREKAVDDLYEEISSAIDQILYKHKTLSTSVEAFVQHLKQLFNKKPLLQPQINVSTTSGTSSSSTVIEIESEAENLPSKTLVSEVSNTDVLFDTASSDLSITSSNDIQKSKRRIVEQQCLLQELTSLEEERKLLYEQWTRLRKALVIETDVLIKFKLETQEQEKIKEIDQIVQKIQRLEDNL